jgi:acyl-CoA thioesterase-2
MRAPMTSPLIDLRATHNDHRWFLRLEETHCVGPKGHRFMFGGVGMGAAIAAMERTCGRPAIWATAQYLSYARPGSVVDIDVRVPAHGKTVSQARVIAHVGDKEILTVNAALGERPGGAKHQWVEAPKAPPPSECPESHRWPGQEDGLHGQFEVRIAVGADKGDRKSGPSADGRRVIWLRPRSGGAIDSAMLAIMADHVPSGAGAALGRDAGGNSLDNTIRFLDPEPTEWVLGDIAIIASANGFAHGAIRLFADSGRLMATASQSMILRYRDEAAGVDDG